VSHMFLMNYVTSHASGMVESGKAVVAAESHEQAHDLLCLQLQLPPSRTRSESIKIKPPCYTLESRERHPETKPSQQARPEREREQRTRFHANISVSNVVGHNERQVLRKIGEDLFSRGMQTQSKHHLQLTVDCWQADGPEAPSRSMSPMEKIETYATRNGRVQGGLTKGR